MNGSAVSATLIASRFLDAYYKTMHDDPDQMHFYYVDDAVFVRLEESGKPAEPAVGPLVRYSSAQLRCFVLFCFVFAIISDYD